MFFTTPNYKYDRTFDDMWKSQTIVSSPSNYPPYNIVKENIRSYRLEFALAGLKKDDIVVSQHRKILSVSSRETDSKDETKDDFIHRGIGKRKFNIKFNLADMVFVKGTSLVDGVLIIKLGLDIPEEEQPKYFDIASNIPEFLSEDEKVA